MISSHPRTPRPPRDQIVFVFEGSISLSRLTVLLTGIILGLGSLGAAIVSLLTRYVGF